MRLVTRFEEIAAFIRAFGRTKQLVRTLKTRCDVENWQNARIAHWMQTALPHAQFYNGLTVDGIADLPLVDKSRLMAEFAAFNALHLSAEEGWRHFREGTHPHGHFVGASTGTSGNRGLYVISNRERFEWLGTVLAKTLPDFPFKSARVAVILPLNSPLYQSANQAFRLKLRFFDLNDGLERLPEALEVYRPDTIIAPPKVLRFLAESQTKLAPERMFSGAEVLDAADRRIVEAAFGIKLGEIYMATEGLLGVTCTEGTMHLAEDVLHFEFEEPGEGSELKNPVITDFTRHTQIMARYRMNDLLRLKKEPCACGSPYLAVEEIIGRSDDILLIRSHDHGGFCRITPDVLRNVIVDTDRTIDDFRVRQVSATEVEVDISPKAAHAVEAVQKNLSALFRQLQAHATIHVRACVLAPPLHKLRRVSRLWSPPENE